MARLTKTNVQQKIRGPVFSVMTPFIPKTDEIDYPALERFLMRIHKAGGQVFYVMAYNSRYSQMTFEEIRHLNAFVCRFVKACNPDHLVIVADPPHCSTRVTAEFAEHALENGADMISMIVRERFYSEEQIYRHFELVAKAVPIPLLIHEMPFLNGYGGPQVNWPVSLLNRLADMESVLAIKEDAKDDAYSLEVIRAIRDRVSIIISGGDQSQWIRFVDEGCQAWLIGIGVFDPRLSIRFYREWQAGNREFCNQLIQNVERPFFEEGVKKFGWHLTIKAALEALGVMSRHDRMPLMPLHSKEAKQIAKLMERLPIDLYV
jgi:4-hydroxy-tetrahydrodipicolinate synthase